MCFCEKIPSCLAPCPLMLEDRHLKRLGLIHLQYLTRPFFDATRQKAWEILLLYQNYHSVHIHVQKLQSFWFLPSEGPPEEADLASGLLLISSSLIVVERVCFLLTLAFEPWHCCASRWLELEIRIGSGISGFSRFCWEGVLCRVWC